MSKKLNAAETVMLEKSAPATIDQSIKDKTSIGWCSPEFASGCVLREEKEA